VTLNRDLVLLLSAAFLRSAGIGLTGVLLALYLVQAGLSAAAIGVVVAVGLAGAVYSRDDGDSWTTIDALNYWSVGFASPRAGWAVGARGRITKLSGF